MSDITHHGSAAPSSTATQPVAPARIMAGFAALALLAAGLMLAMAAPKLLNDPDTLWHIALGRDIVTTGIFPVTDSYSHTFAGEPWIAKQWLSGVLLALAHMGSGWTGVVALTIGALLATMAIVHGALARHLNPVVALLLAVWFFAMASSTFLARPHALALPVAVWFIIHVWQAAARGAAPRWAALGAMVLWANMHGGFTLGFVATAVAFGHFLMQDPLWARWRRWTPALIWRRRTVRNWIAFLALLPIAACIHPYGWQSIASTFVIADNPALAHIGEWRPYAFGEDRVLTLHLVAGIVFLLATGLRTSLAKAAFLTFLLYISLAHIRFVTLLYLLPAALLASEIARAFPALSLESWRARPARDALERLAGRYPRGLMAAAAAGIVLALLAPVSSGSVSPGARTYPVAALEAVRDAGIAGHVLNGYDFGGALIFKGIPTFIDGRADRLFDNGAFIAAHFSADGDADALEATLVEHDIGWTLLPPGDPAVALLDARADWVRLYSDDHAVVHVPAGS
ncbi:MAG: hypothetical protein JJ920_11735 [Roseitalea sp.]|jgi:hypothetical protein|nr:hypothetical protein [Roseitalea sp.]MBO6722957.1 hypothetical protein [Roseitalea sp.]MBO6743577.1 hypothetical protein [Roseitalea sp.]